MSIGAKADRLFTRTRARPEQRMRFAELNRLCTTLFDDQGIFNVT